MIIFTDLDGTLLDLAATPKSVRVEPIFDAEKDIRGYLDTGEWQGKAGAYAIQGRAGAFVEEIRGSFSDIVGLPLCETALLLRAFGYPI